VLASMSLQSDEISPCGHAPHVFLTLGRRHYINKTQHQDFDPLGRAGSILSAAAYDQMIVLVRPSNQDYRSSKSAAYPTQTWHLGATEAKKLLLSAPDDMLRTRLRLWSLPPPCQPPCKHCCGQEKGAHPRAGQSRHGSFRIPYNRDKKKVVDPKLLEKFRSGLRESLA